jgi:hypothetical protein
MGKGLYVKTPEGPDREARRSTSSGECLIGSASTKLVVKQAPSPKALA